jgi:hypothetical protein
MTFDEHDQIVCVILKLVGSGHCNCSFSLSIYIYIVCHYLGCWCQIAVVCIHAVFINWPTFVLAVDILLLYVYYVDWV